MSATSDPPRHHINVVADDVTAAIAFYSKVFRASAVQSGSPGCSEIPISESIVLDVIAKGARPLDEVTLPSERGPRMELVVDDVDDWVQGFLSEGAKLVVALAPGSDGVLHRVSLEESPTYVHVRDPFGYLWAIAMSKVTEP